MLYVMYLFILTQCPSNLHLIISSSSSINMTVFFSVRKLHILNENTFNFQFQRPNGNLWFKENRKNNKNRKRFAFNKNTSNNWNAVNSWNTNNPFDSVECFVLLAEMKRLAGFCHRANSLQVDCFFRIINLIDWLINLHLCKRKKMPESFTGNLLLLFCFPFHLRPIVWAKSICCNGHQSIREHHHQITF